MPKSYLKIMVAVGFAGLAVPASAADLGSGFSVTAGLSYVDTSGHFYTPSGRDAAKAGVVASVGVAF